MLDLGTTFVASVARDPDALAIETFSDRRKLEPQADAAADQRQPVMRREVIEPLAQACDRADRVATDALGGSVVWTTHTAHRQHSSWSRLAPLKPLSNNCYAGSPATIEQ